jgi:hypothetical protein
VTCYRCYNNQDQNLVISLCLTLWKIKAIFVGMIGIWNFMLVPLKKNTCPHFECVVQLFTKGDNKTIFRSWFWLQDRFTGSGNKF